MDNIVGTGNRQSESKAPDSQASKIHEESRKTARKAFGIEASALATAEEPKQRLPYRLTHRRLSAQHAIHCRTQSETHEASVSGSGQFAAPFDGARTATLILLVGPRMRQRELSARARR